MGTKDNLDELLIFDTDSGQEIGRVEYLESEDCMGIRRLTQPEVTFTATATFDNLWLIWVLIGEYSIHLGDQGGIC